ALDAVSQAHVGPSLEGLAPCTLPEAQRWVPGAVINLVDAEEYCDVTAVPVTVLNPSVAGEHPDPNDFALMTSTGRFVTRAASSVTIWDSTGTVEHTFGRSGQGPGEFAS